VGPPTNRTSIYADIPAGYRFNKWIINGSGSIDHVNQPIAVFEFGNGDCTIEATFKKIQTQGMNLLYYLAPVSLKSRP